MVSDLSIEEVLTRGVEKIYPDKAGLAGLMAKKKIRLYQGFDPSMPNLHLGNYVGLLKLRQFQKLGHEVIFLIGDFTGMIGDPTDKTATRKQLTRQEVLKNAVNWKKQAGMILDFTGKNPAKLMFNSTWNDKVTFKDLIEITSNFTLQQMQERDMFAERLRKNLPVYLHELLYPVAQAIDCINMDVNLEIGGSDQIFNMLTGRTLMKALKNKDKYVLATKLLVDNQGQKVGKTTGNALFLNSSPTDFYAGIMSFSDDVILLGFEILTELPLNGLSEKVAKNPLEQKKRLAFEIVKILWGERSADDAQRKFETTFQKRQPDFTTLIPGRGDLASTIEKLPAVGSKSQAKRLVAQKAVDVNGRTVADPTYQVRPGDTIKVGEKIFVKVR